MKKSLFTLVLIVAIATLGSLKAQVTIGANTDPKATLDVVGQPTTATSLDGVIAPRLTGDQLRAKTYTTAQTGAIVYATVADTAPAGQTIKVTAPGYYYFDGTIWQKLSPSEPVVAFRKALDLRAPYTMTQTSETGGTPPGIYKVEDDVDLVICNSIYENSLPNHEFEDRSTYVSIQFPVEPPVGRQIIITNSIYFDNYPAASGYNSGEIEIHNGTDKFRIINYYPLYTNRTKYAQNATTKTYLYVGKNKTDGYDEWMILID